MHLVCEKLQPFLDITEPTGELSLKVQSEKRQGFSSSPLMELIIPFEPAT